MIFAEIEAEFAFLTIIFLFSFLMLPAQATFFSYTVYFTMILTYSMTGLRLFFIKSLVYLNYSLNLFERA